MELVQQLKQEHVGILQGFKSIKEGISSGRARDAIRIYNYVRCMRD